ncbi:hypothetical protein GB928_018735 [Shinella curvata]|uniref:Uncharacterized protein n=1 Tax=Shinella curvata TaxID=1817964 RepID=A0ABT8XIQ4_9HYPH|nr:hypothetical protein [Shinella curvata]MCJ8053897.1 hypothetical protein [Shinella curvata]MDO6123229.1 hypothetical protein [Shinella curvata]
MNLEKLLCAELKRQLEAKGACVMQVPAGGELLWRWFLDLSRTRRAGLAGPEPISYGEIEAYARSTCWPVEPRHIAVLRAMDEVWMEYAREKTTPAPEGVKTLPPISTTPLTAGMLDVMLGG